MLTNIKDIDDQILLQLDAKTLLSYHYVNKLSNKYFDTVFWNNKFNYDNIPIIKETTLHEYIKCARCVKLVKMLFIISDMNKDDNIYINLGKCKLKTILLNTPLTELYEKISRSTFLNNLVIRIEQYKKEYCLEILKYPTIRIGRRNENFFRDIKFNTVFLVLYKAFYYNLLVDDDNGVPFIVEDREFDYGNAYSTEKYYYERYGQYQLLNYIPDNMFNSLYNNLNLY